MVGTDDGDALLVFWADCLMRQLRRLDMIVRILNQIPEICDQVGLNGMKRKILGW